MDFLLDEEKKKEKNTSSSDKFAVQVIYDIN